MSEATTKPAKYLAKYLNLRIVRKSAMTREVNGQAITSPGESIRFEQGMYTTSDPEEQAFIEARPEFAKGIVIKVPDNVQDMVKARGEWVKDLETRELEAELERRKKGVQATKDSVKGAGEGDEGEKPEVLESKKLAELVEIAKNEGITSDVVEPFTKPGAKKAPLIELIQKNREANAGAGNEPAY